MVFQILPPFSLIFVVAITVPRPDKSQAIPELRLRGDLGASPECMVTVSYNRPPLALLLAESRPLLWCHKTLHSWKALGSQSLQTPPVLQVFVIRGGVSHLPWLFPEERYLPCYCSVYDLYMTVKIALSILVKRLNFKRPLPDITLLPRFLVKTITDSFNS